MRVVNEAVQDGVGVSWVSNDVVPGCHGKLRGDYRRSTPVAFFEDFEEVVTSGSIEGFETPVIEDEQLDTAERAQETGITAIAASEREVGEEFGNTLVEHGAVVATGFVTER